MYSSPDLKSDYLFFVILAKISLMIVPERINPTTISTTTSI